MFSSDEKESVKKIYTYLLSIREKFKSELNCVENDISRIKILINNAENDKDTVKSTFDNTYMILSSSQVAKSDEFAEIDSLEKLIECKKKDLDNLNNSRKNILKNISELEDVISCVNKLAE